jgi:hypothetical protein
MDELHATIEESAQKSRWGLRLMRLRAGYAAPSAVPAAHDGWPFLTALELWQALWTELD